MSRFELTGPAQRDVVMILETSTERWGEHTAHRYADLLESAMQTAAADPTGPTTVDRGSVRPGLRSMHVDLTRERHGVKSPVHVLYFKQIGEDLIEIVRVLHERQAPTRHIDEDD